MELSHTSLVPGFRPEAKEGPSGLDVQWLRGGRQCICGTAAFDWLSAGTVIGPGGGGGAAGKLFLPAGSFVFLRGVCGEVPLHPEQHPSDPRPRTHNLVCPGEAAPPLLRPSLLHPARRVSEPEVPGARVGWT